MTGAMSFESVDFNDNQVSHTQFWNRYDRPPRREYWDYIVARRDLLVPQDVRERKGSFFTPKRWVELSQQYLAAELGEDWQDEYYVWDCAAGTGNFAERADQQIQPVGLNARCPRRESDARPDRGEIS